MDKNGQKHLNGQILIAFVYLLLIYLRTDKHKFNRDESG